MNENYKLKLSLVGNKTRITAGQYGNYNMNSASHNSAKFKCGFGVYTFTFDFLYNYSKLIRL